MVGGALHRRLQRGQQCAGVVQAQLHRHAGPGPSSGLRKSMFTVWSCSAWTGWSWYTGAVRSGNQPCGPFPLLAATSIFSVR